MENIFKDLPLIPKVPARGLISFPFPAGAENTCPQRQRTKKPRSG